MTVNNDLFEAQTPNKNLIEEQFEVQRWLRDKNRGTKYVYLAAIKAFIEYTGLSPQQLIDQAEEDRKKPIRQQGNPEFKVSSFFQYLISDYLQKGKGRNDRKPNGKKGLSRNLACSYTNAIRGFYRQNGFPLIVDIPKAVNKKENNKLPIRVPEIKRLIEASANLRDRAIILTLAQSGISLNELCNLNYGDIADELQTNVEPLHLHLIRQKEQVEYDTFLGTDSIQAIKAYLEQRIRENEILNFSSPLFLTEFTTNSKKSRSRIYAALVEDRMKRAALTSGLVTRKG